MMQRKVDTIDDDYGITLSPQTKVSLLQQQLEDQAQANQALDRTRLKELDLADYETNRLLQQVCGICVQCTYPYSLLLLELA